MTTRTKWQEYWRARDKRDRKRCNIRWMDRYHFKKMLPKEIYEKYEIHHEWVNGARCILLTPEEHRNITAERR